MLSPQDYLRRMRSSAVYNVAIRSPLEDCPLLSEHTGNRILLKREDLQPVFSFKLRGAYNMMARLSPDALDRGVIAASAGNHAQGVALAAQRLNTHATIIVPRTTPEIKIDAIRRRGATLILHGDSYDEAYHHARNLSELQNLTFVHPYDDPDVIAGQGTIGLEIDEQFPEKIDAVFVAVGGGGLIAGIALALKQLRPGIKIIGVEPEDSDAMKKSLGTDRRETLDRVGLFADGVAVRTPGVETFRIARQWVDEIITVSNDAICGAIKEIFDDRRALLEPAGALAYAGIKKYPGRGQTLVAIACGANLNFDRLRHVAERAQIGEQREAVLAIRIPERPGAFRALYETLEHRSISEFNYRMGDPDQAVVFAGIEIRNAEESKLAIDKLNRAGYETIDLTEDEIAKAHVRHMVGGRAAHATNERLFHFDFPERPGALGDFLNHLSNGWNISLFHYRNHGSDVGRVLAGVQIRPENKADFEASMNELGYRWTEVTDNPAIKLFL